MALFLSQLKDFYIKARGFHTDRKFVVFESDDWGSIRMPSKETFEKLQNLGDNPEKDGFLSNDCLENEEDLQALYEVLRSVFDSKGNHPVFTMNFAMANPDFDNIDFENRTYAYEPFYKTYSKYYGENQILNLVKDGYSNKLILPQLHCREHLNVGRWMHDLQQHKPDALLAFEHKMIGIGASFHTLNRFGYMDAFNTDCSTKEELAQIIKDAVKMFAETFGFPSLTFAAACFVWNNDIEQCLNESGVRYIQSACWQHKPLGTDGKYALKRTLHYTGQKNRNGQLYSVRNCSFEPAYKQNPQDCVQNCLNEIAAAFKSRVPAIVNTHRFNFIGTVNPQNRDHNLLGLKALLNKLVEEYPDVEFLSSPELFSIMEK